VQLNSVILQYIIIQYICCIASHYVIMINMKLSLFLTEHHTMKTSRRVGGIAPVILNLSKIKGKGKVAPVLN